MLIKRSIVERWYQTDSWVYKNFAYLFKNPLWNKSIPRGFTVCPYFWLSLISLFLFRPLVVSPVRYIFMPIIGFLGKPASAIDSTLFNIFIKMGLAKEQNRSEGMGLLFAFLFAIILASVGFVVWMLVLWLKKFYPFFTKNSVPGMFSFWATVSLIGLLAMIGLHKKLTDSACKVVNYLYLWFALFIVSSIVFIPHQIKAGASIVAKFLWSEVIIGWSWIVDGSHWVGHIAWVVFTWIPIHVLYLPWWAYLLILTVFGYFADRILGFFEQQIASPEEPLDETQFQERNRYLWTNLIFKTLMADPYYKSGKIFYDPENYDVYDGSKFMDAACLTYKDMILRKAVETLFSNELDELQKQHPNPSRFQMIAFKCNGSWLSRVEYLLDNTGVKFDYRTSDLRRIIASVTKTPQIAKLLSEAIEILYKESTEINRRKEIRKNSWSHQTCIKITHVLGRLAESVGSKIKWTIVQVWTLMSYLWILVKAKKQGACPYFQFTEPKKKD